MTDRRKCILLDAAAATVLLAGIAAGFVSDGGMFLCPACTLWIMGIIVLLLTRLVPGKVRKSAAGLIGVTVLVVVCAVYWVYTALPGTMFRTFVLDPIPESVRFERSEFQRGVGDHSAYLAFTLDPCDLPAILRARAYKVQPGTKTDSFGDPGWWRPESLSNPRLYVAEETNNSYSTVRLWVGDANSAALFAHIRL